MWLLTTIGETWELIEIIPTSLLDAAQFLYFAPAVNP
jgi:hypothetical protein